jgi:hypothetical protein
LAAALATLLATGLVAAAVRTAAAAAPSAAPSSVDLQPLQSGLAARFQEAARNLGPGGDRLKATHALDAARRLARVETSIVGCPQAASAAPLRRLEAARRALQNGRTRAAIALLGQAGPLSAPSSACPPGPSAAGKLVINSRGERIGRLASLSPAGQAVLKVGGAINWLGFIDFDNRRTTVPAGQLVEGRRMVVLLNG